MRKKPGASQKTAFLFTYNPDKNFDKNPVDWSRLAKRNRPKVSWSTTSPKMAKKEDRFYLLQQGKRGRGIFGCGIIVGKHKEKDPDFGHLVRVEFSHLVNPKDRFLISEDVFRRIVPADKPALRSPQRSGLVVPPGIAEAFDREIARRHRHQERLDPPALPAPVVEGSRERQLREIEIRQGAGAFRDDLMRAYQERCAITGCAVAVLLDAAHIKPYADQGPSNVANGLLLRTDLHTAFDRHLIWIDPDTMEVQIAPSIQDPTYRDLHGRKLRAPSHSNDASDPEALRLHAAEAANKHGVPVFRRAKRRPPRRVG